MRLLRWGLMTVLVVVLGSALYQTVLWFGLWGNTGEAPVLPLADGAQEIALIEPSTNIDEWGRLVAAMRLIEKDWPRLNPSLGPLRVSLANAFPSLTADVPEIVLSLAKNPAQELRLRWYKISGEHDAASWVKKLHARGRPPLVVLGGGTSDRAVRLAHAMQRTYTDQEKPSPVLLLTTATADKTKSGKPLIEAYPGRSFRFAFTNRRMVESLLQFVHHRDDKELDWARSLSVAKAADPHQLANAVASMAGCGNFWYSCAVIAANANLEPFTMYAFSWDDERYSKDMTFLFEEQFKDRCPLGEFVENSIAFSVGGFFQPAPQEQVAVGTFLARTAPIAPHSFLVLPTQTVRMRRFLINLRQRSPLDARNLVVLNGDAVAFNSVYRDREVMWNILDLPYSLVFFTHRNPVDRAAGFTDKANGSPARTTTSTQDLLLYCDIFEAILFAVHDQGVLLGDPDQVVARMRTTSWLAPGPGQGPARVGNRQVHGDRAGNRLLFDTAGNRQSHTGEHIVWVKPNFFEDRVDLTSKISVWAIRAPTERDAWQLVEAFDATYNQSRPEEIAP